MARKKPKKSKLKKVLLLIAFIITALAVGTWIAFLSSSEKKIHLTNQYTEKNRHFSVKYLPHWTYIEPRESAVMFKGKAGTPDADSDILIARITYQNKSGIYQDEKAYLNFVKGFFQKVKANPLTLEEGPIDVIQANGQVAKGRFLKLQYTFNNRQYIQYEILLNKNDGHTFYVLAYNAPVTKFHSGFPIFKAMTRTFQME